MQVKNVINLLGYSKATSLYYPDSITQNRSIKKIFNNLNCNAIYCIKEKPFIVFLEIKSNEIEQSITHKIWNYQIPIVIVCFINHVVIYNGCSINDEKELIQVEDVAVKDLSTDSPFSFWKISSPSFWGKYATKFQFPHLDDIMLENIAFATKRLAKTPCKPFATQLILRLIFIRYLIDRGVDLNYKNFNGNIKKAQESFLRTLNDKSELYALFSYLKQQFHGNLFELYIDGKYTEYDLINSNTLKILSDLMSGNLEMSSGQYSLFQLYDFNVIPVELISNIYERFLLGDRQSEDKAFYTPPYLVDYLLSQTIDEHIKNSMSCKVLDPSCGSGIFLVETARRLIEQNSKTHELSDQHLSEIVTSNIFGIDKNQEAIDVAIFSLYIILLDYKDPKTIKKFDLPLLKGKNFSVCDYFSKEATFFLEGKYFDFIIGNPPWGKIKGEHVNYCKSHNLPIQNEEISRSFIYRSKDFATNKTICCQIVTSKLFYNLQQPAINFRKWLLEETEIHTYIEFAIVRKLIFDNANGPAAVIIYKFNQNKNENEKHKLCHISLKSNVFFKLFHIIVIQRHDYKYVQQAFLKQYDWAWKLLVYGHAQDFQIIKHLKDSMVSIKDIVYKYNLHYGVGISYSTGDKQDASHLLNKWLIDARKGIKPYEVIMECGKIFDKKHVHRAKYDSQYLFNAPFVLIKKGFNTKSYKFRAAYSEKSFIYSDAITGICGEKKHRQILLSLTGIINSSLYAYLNLMLGSSSGIEREQQFLLELFTYPAFVDEHLSELVTSLEKQLVESRKHFLAIEEKITLIKEIDDYILSKLHLTDDVFVDYALNVQIPMISNNITEWPLVSKKELKSYAMVFLDYFSKLFCGKEKYIQAKVLSKKEHHYCIIEFFILKYKPDERITFLQQNDSYSKILMEYFIEDKINDVFYKFNDIIRFKKNSFYVLKTDEAPNWHPAMAQLDLEDIISSILEGNDK